MKNISTKTAPKGSSPPTITDTGIDIYHACSMPAVSFTHIYTRDASRLPPARSCRPLRARAHTHTSMGTTRSPRMPARYTHTHTHTVRLRGTPHTNTQHACQARANTAHMAHTWAHEDAQIGYPQMHTYATTCSRQCVPCRMRAVYKCQIHAPYAEYTCHTYAVIQVPYRSTVHVRYTT